MRIHQISGTDPYFVKGEKTVSAGVKRSLVPLIAQNWWNLRDNTYLGCAKIVDCKRRYAKVNTATLYFYWITRLNTLRMEG